MADQIPHFPKERENEKNKKVFFWLDILGFSDSLKREEEYLRLADLLEKFRRSFNRIQELSANVISDGIILSLKKTNSKFNFERACQLIAEKQLEFILETGCFLRGGIAVGTMFEMSDNEKCKHCNLDRDQNNCEYSRGENKSIGNGLAKAYNIESSSVDWPVIGTNQEEFDALRALLNAEDDDPLGLSIGVNYRGQKLYFINYLKNSQLLKSIIQNCKNEFIRSEKPRIWCKYEWLLQQYESNNEFISPEVLE